MQTCGLTFWGKRVFVNTINANLYADAEVVELLLSLTKEGKGKRGVKLCNIDPPRPVRNIVRKYKYWAISNLPGKKCVQNYTKLILQSLWEGKKYVQKLTEFILKGP